MRRVLHPGKILLELFIKEHHLSITETANCLGISRQSLSELVNGKNGITAQTALRLAKAFNTSSHYWLNLQMNYDLSKASKSLNLDKVKCITKTTAS